MREVIHTCETGGKCLKEDPAISLLSATLTQHQIPVICGVLLHATFCGISEGKSPRRALRTPERFATKITVLRFATPGELCAVTGAVSGPPKSDGHFRIARYPKIGIETTISENYCE